MAITRKTAQQKIDEYKAKIKAIQAAERNKGKAKKKDITSDTEGVANLIKVLDDVAKANKVKRPVLIKALAKITRSGLKFVEK